MGHIYKFDDYLLDPAQQRLQRDGEEISLSPKVFEVLTLLVERHGQLINHEEIMNEVWQETFVEETNLRFCIHSLRKALGKDFIETVPKRGYRFACEVTTYTTEEFIKAYTSNENISDDGKTDEGKIQKKSLSLFFAKPIWLLAVIALLAVTGLSAFVIWKKRGITEKPTPKSLQSLTVLPFIQVGDKTESSDYLQRGLTDALIINLSKIKELNVTPTRSIEKFFGKKIEPLTVGREFKSDVVLDGSYRFEGNSVRVSVRLLRVNNGETLWRDTISVESGNQIELENAISFRIAGKIQIFAAKIKDEHLIRNENVSRETLEDYLLARQILRSNEYNRREEIIRLFEKIIAAEPDWVLGYAGYAEALTLTFGVKSDWDKTVAIAQKAIELDNTRPEPYMAMGMFYKYHRDWDKAAESFKTAIKLDPELALAYHEYGTMLDVQRRFAEAETMLKKSIELEPFSPLFYTLLCEHYYYDKQYNEALLQCNNAKKIDPDFWLVNKKLYWIYVKKEMYDEMEKLEYGNLSDADKAKHPLAKPLMDRNMNLYWQRALERRANNPNRKNSPVAIAAFYAQLGDKENALKYLEEASQNIEFELQSANPNPVFDLLRKEERFVNLMKKLNLTP